jgi:Ca2+-transporting ATPase
MVFRGTAVTGGSGTGIVVATGLLAQVGRIQRLVGAAPAPQTPMQRQLEDLGRRIAWVSLGLGAAVLLIGVVRGYSLLQVVRSALSLAVAAVPEGLPAVATTTLALGIEDMRRRKVLVRRLDAVETMTSVRVVCFDKTGTLTLNRMAVQVIACGNELLRDPKPIMADGGRWAVSRSRIERLIQIAVLCSETELAEIRGETVLSGSATENALVQFALDCGLDVHALRRAHPCTGIQRRSEAYRLMATTHRLGGNQDLIAVKGSPGEVLSRCGWEDAPDGNRRLTDERRAAIEELNAEMAADALRVLGFAYKRLPRASGADNGARTSDLTWVGLAGLADPLRPGLPDFMAALHRAGIHTVMLTGDQSATARAVAGRLGLGNGRPLRVLDAPDLDGVAAGQMAEAVRTTQVFARVSPAQKLRIIRAFQESGCVVAMVGDGINDSPALRAADIGIALGKEGTSAAREVADIVLETDDLSTLLAAIERGRTTTANIRKSIHYLLATNLSECMVMLAGASAGIAEPLSPMQLLWINLISDVLPGIGLALESPRTDILNDRVEAVRRPILASEDRLRLAKEAAVLSAGSLACCALGSLRHGAGSPAMRSMTFGSLVTAQLLHAVTARSQTHSLFDAERLPPNRALQGFLGASLALQAAAFLLPGARRLLGLGAIGPVDVGLTLAGGIAPFLVNEVNKTMRDRTARPAGRNS